MKRLVGSIVQITIKIGRIYGICTHDLGRDGQILMMFRPVFPDDLPHPERMLFGEPVRTWIRFPLRHATKQPDIKIVGAVELKEGGPIFRPFGLPVFLHQESGPRAGGWLLARSRNGWTRYLWRWPFCRKTAFRGCPSPKIGTKEMSCRRRLKGYCLARLISHSPN
ncbi:hypothetical protein TRP8649_03359 [Pelagimonas phthalicica]|uniref:Uncharacterized protein n=1 Tax=Pelagimonas phthalicica TaxID=1037362 RepID=A0A238JHD2_9RHOB|nr:hypothetical protein CLV87_3356 [Pelagimonas phthalicica]SMX29226.1 hypothetical protein TRP8649_03359 [Pelagimonas phthalicica]